MRSLLVAIAATVELAVMLGFGFAPVITTGAVAGSILGCYSLFDMLTKN